MRAPKHVVHTCALLELVCMLTRVSFFNCFACSLAHNQDSAMFSGEHDGDVASYVSAHLRDFCVDGCVNSCVGV